MNEWISVKDRLPDKGGKYLCVCRSSWGPYMDILEFSPKLSKLDKYDFSGKNYPGWADYDGEYGWYEMDDVTHWMPLPELPEVK